MQFAPIYFLFFCTIIATGCVQNPSAESNAVEAKTFQVRKMKIPTWAKNASLYEVNIRQITEEGTFAAFQKHLPRIKEMGISTIWLMPIYPIGFDKRKGTLGNPYSIADFTKVNPELGTFEDLKTLVSEIHRMHMHVIMDWVANHTAWDHSWISTQPEWYTHHADTITHPFDPDGNPTDWYDVADLNYAIDPMRHTMVESMKFWLRSIDVDGFRCDVAHFLPNDFWDEVRPALDAIKPTLMIAESEGIANHFETCFQANYGWQLYHLLNDVAQGKANASDIHTYLEEDRAKYPLGYYHLNFISNHDENSRVGSAKQRLGPATEAMATIAFTFEGMPLLYNGQEIGLDRSLSFYERDPIIWHKADSLSLFYKKLIHLKTYNKALWNGNNGGKMISLSEDPNIFAYLRTHDDNTVVTIVNCTGKEVRTKLNRNIRSLTNLFTGKDFTVKEGREFRLDPWQYMVLSNPSIIL